MAKGKATGRAKPKCRPSAPEPVPEGARFLMHSFACHGQGGHMPHPAGRMMIRVSATAALLLSGTRGPCMGLPLGLPLGTGSSLAHASSSWNVDDQNVSYNFLAVVRYHRPMHGSALGPAFGHSLFIGIIFISRPLCAMPWPMLAMVSSHIFVLQMP